MIHFYHHPLSPYSRKVFFLLEESRLAYDLQVVSLERREQRAPEYLAVNPSGRVPAIRDGELPLGESNASYGISFGGLGWTNFILWVFRIKRRSICGGSFARYISIARSLISPGTESWLKNSADNLISE
jgi:hypothetical protein